MDRAPDADEDHHVGDQPQEVALRHVPHREHRLEQQVERGEQREGRAEREPPVEILATPSIAVGEREHGDEIHERERGKAAAPEWLVMQRSGRAERRQPGHVRDEPDRQHRHGDSRGHVGEREASALDPPPCERGEREHRPAGEHAAEARPRLGRALGALDHRRAEREGDPRHRHGGEPAAEQQVVAPALDHEPGSRQQRGEPAADRVQRREHEPRLRQIVGRSKARLREEKGERGAEQSDERDLAREECLERVLAGRLAHRPSYRHNRLGA